MTNRNANRHLKSHSGVYTTSRVRPEPRSKPSTPREALLKYQDGRHCLYAFRLADGVIKIGCTVDVYNRSKQLGGEVLAILPGNMADEAKIHEALRPHVARGREYYHPTPEVIDMVNEMRDHFALPHIAA